MACSKSLLHPSSWRAGHSVCQHESIRQVRQSAACRPSGWGMVPREWAALTCHPRSVGAWSLKDHCQGGGCTSTLGMCMIALHWGTCVQAPPWHKACVTLLKVIYRPLHRGKCTCIRSNLASAAYRLCMSGIDQAASFKFNKAGLPVTLIRLSICSVPCLQSNIVGLALLPNSPFS